MSSRSGFTVGDASPAFAVVSLGGISVDVPDRLSG